VREPSERADGLYDELLPKLVGTAALTPREQAALDFAEALAAARPSVDDTLMARLRAVFSDAEIVELGFAAGGFLMWGRLHRAFDVPASGPGYHAMLAQKSAGLPDAGSPSH
jgi:alkylhydroperoxidase family enzyme